MKKQSVNTLSGIATALKELRAKAGLTQEELARRSGVGLRFVREVEQGKQTVRVDKVNQVLALFGYHLEAVKDRETSA
jgi:y4mF family transcriptional regulator